MYIFFVVAALYPEHFTSCWFCLLFISIWRVFLIPAWVGWAT